MPFSRANAEMEMKTPPWRDGLRPVPKFVPICGAHAPSRAGFGASPKHFCRKNSAIAGVRSPARQARALPGRDPAFTLIELIIVIVIIAVLAGLAFPVFQGVQNQAKKVQAKNDLVQIVTAVNAFYTEYGQYPCAAQTGADSADYVPPDDAARKTLFDTLRVPIPGTPPALNPRAIVFLQVSPVKTDVVGQRRNGVGSDGVFYDPWGSAYQVKIDNNYNGTLINPYTADTGAGPATLNFGVIAWCLGKNGALGGGSAVSSSFVKESGVAGQYANSSDVISWQ
jgi:prepilin-type N-terminal cleavage/methylation domain-containing protein